MIRATSILLLAAGFALPALAQVTVGPVVHPTTGARYYRTVPGTWPQVDAVANALGGSLATIQDAETNEWIRANVASANGNVTDCYIGLNDFQSEGTYLWATGERPVYFNWFPGEPNDFGSFEDATVLATASGLWNDLPHVISRPAIVECTGPIRVPLEFATIQEAIDIAQDGQTIIVAPGTYDGGIDYGTKKLVIRSAAGPVATTIRAASGTFGVAMLGGQGSETVFEGFTVVEGPGQTSCLIVAANGQVIRNCRFMNRNGTSVLLQGTSTLSDSLIVRSQVAVLAQPSGGRTDVTVQNCTIAGNTAGVGAVLGGPGAPVTVRLTNSISAGNVTPFSASAGCTILFRSNVVAEGPVGPTNLHGDPQFLNAPGANGIYDLNDNFTLQSTSPCIDAGNNSLRKALTSLVLPTDLAGNIRFVDDPNAQNVGAGPGPMSDCGAFEYQPVEALCQIDFNGDGFVDFFDYDAFVEAFETGC